MTGEHRLPASRRLLPAIAALGWLVVLASTARCGHGSGPGSTQSPVTLRIGFGNVPQAGLRQVNTAMALEGLVRLHEDGRPSAWLADRWTVASDSLTLTIRVRPNAIFHDGSPVTPAVVTDNLRSTLPRTLGPVFDDVDTIASSGQAEVSIHLKQPSPFVLESLETGIHRPGQDGIGTGAFAVVPGNAAALRAFDGPDKVRPAIAQITETAYPSVRAAWADLLRGNIDMLWEVNTDALDSLQGSSDVALFSYVRHYQYAITFGPRARSLESADVRRELNAAIDRQALVQAALAGHGVPSTGPVPPRHWAFDASAPRLRFDATLAKKLAGRHLSFTCLVPADSDYEHVALAVKQQLAAAGVDMRVQEASQQEFAGLVQQGNFEAALVDPISGPSLFRAYRQFHSNVPFNPKPRTTPRVDAALDRIRHAAKDDEYRAGVTSFQQAIVDDPPALFLAWGERARAVSRRFEVPPQEKGIDVFSTIREWRPASAHQSSTN